MNMTNEVRTAAYTLMQRHLTEPFANDEERRLVLRQADDACEILAAWLDAQAEAPELYIWWLNQAEHEAVSRLGAPHPYDANVVATMEWPVYLAKEFRSLEGRPLHGRLWVATHIDLTGIEWDEDKPASRLASERGGIVIEACDLPVVFDLPGFVTDLHLNFANVLCRREEVMP